MNIMEIDGYRAKIEYDADLDQFRGEILGLNGNADFYGKSSSALRKEFKLSLQIFLEVCEEKGISPIKEYSGKFNLTPILFTESIGTNPHSTSLSSTTGP